MVVFELDSVVVDWILVWTGLPDGSLAPQSGGFVELCPRLHKLEPSIPNVVCVNFVHVGEIPAGESMMELSSLAWMVWGCLTRCFRLTVTDKSFVRLLCSPCSSSSCCSKPLVFTVAEAATSRVVGYNFGASRKCSIFRRMTTHVQCRRCCCSNLPPKWGPTIIRNLTFFERIFEQEEKFFTGWNLWTGQFSFAATAARMPVSTEVQCNIVHWSVQCLYSSQFISSKYEPQT